MSELGDWEARVGQISALIMIGEEMGEELRQSSFAEGSRFLMLTVGRVPEVTELVFRFTQALVLFSISPFISLLRLMICITSQWIILIG